MGTKRGVTAAAALAGILLLSSIASAEEQYQAEVSGLYNRLDTSENSRTIAYGVSAQAFFAPVRTDEHPYAEAAFLERAGSVTVIAERQDWSGGILKGDGPMFALDVNVAKPGVPIAAEVFYSRSKFDFNLPFIGAMKTDAAGIRIGNYFTNTLFAGVEYVYTSMESSDLGLTSADRGRDYALFAKYVHELEHHQEVSMEATLGKTTMSAGADLLRNTDASIAVDYFFTKGLSAGVGFENSSGTDESVEGKTYSANVRYFFIPQLSVQVFYDRFLNSHPAALDYRTFGVTLAGRF